jgi:hypothetical protein
MQLSGVMKKNWFIAASGLILFFAGSITGSISSFAQTSPAAASTANGESGAQPASEHPDLPSSAIAPKIVEDWSTPALAGSDLKPAEPLVGSTDSQRTFVRELVRVRWRPADPIDLYVIRPAGIKKPPAILYLYSYPFELDRFRDNNFCSFLTRNGFAAVGFASALTAGRFHPPRSLDEWFVSDLQESLATTAHDVQMILNYLASRGDIDMDRVGMFGDGSGATIAILAAAVDPRIKTLDLLDPWGDWPDWLAKSPLVPGTERPEYMKPEFLASVAPLDPVKWLPQLKTQKVRLQLVKSVVITPAEAKQKIEAAAPANVEIIHFASRQEFSSAVAGGRGFDWIKEQLQPGSTHRPTSTNAGLRPDSSVKAAQ